MVLHGVMTTSGRCDGFVAKEVRFSRMLLILKTGEYLVNKLLHLFDFNEVPKGKS